MAVLPRKNPTLADAQRLISQTKDMTRFSEFWDARLDQAWKGVNRSEVEACVHCGYPRRSYAWAWQGRPHCDGRCQEKR